MHKYADNVVQETVEGLQLISLASRFTNSLFQQRTCTVDSQRHMLEASLLKL